MYILKKHVIVQLVMFGLFFLMGLNVLFMAVIPSLETQKFTTYATLGLLIIIAVVGIIIYFSKNQDAIKINEKAIKHSKFILYGYFIVYVIHMIINQLDIKGFKMGIIFGPILMIIALFGMFVQYRTLKDDQNDQTLKR